MKVNNSESNLLYWLSLTPLLLLATEMASGVVIGIVVLLIGGLGLVAQRFIGTRFTSSLSATLLILAVGSGAALCDVFLQAFAWQFYAPIHPYLPLVAINVFYFVTRKPREDATANNEQTKIPTMTKHIAIAAVAIVICGAARELLGTAALFSQMGTLFGDQASDWQQRFAEGYRGIIGDLLAPAVLIGMGLVIASRNWLKRVDPPTPDNNNTLDRVAKRRVRVTGPIA